MGYKLDEIKARIPKLPKWAQRYIGKLERDIEYLRKQRGEIAGEDALITWDLFPSDGVYGIPEHATIYFKTDTGSIEIKLRNGKLTARSAEGGIAVRPNASNTIDLFCIEW